MSKLYYRDYQSPVGLLTIYSDGENVIRLERNRSGIPENARAIVRKPEITEIAKWLDRYFAGKKPATDNLPIDLVGSQFRLTVMNVLSMVPYGKTTTYGEIAEAVARIFAKERMSAQAVGGALGWNPLPIIIPCHRVVGKDRNLTGYSCGIDMKIWLLKHEGIDINSFTLPKEIKKD